MRNAGDNLAVDLLAASAVLDAVGKHDEAKRLRRGMAQGFFWGLLIFGGLALLFFWWVFSTPMR